MSASPGPGRLVPGPGQGAAWVREHGAHLMDYAASHLESGRARAAVVAALVAGRTEAAPERVTVRGRLLAALRRDCRTSSVHRERYVPGSGPGMPDALLIEQVWTIVDPLGTDTLRLMYRHALGMEDVSHVLGMPSDEVGRLATRTQDLIETLVSGLDALAHGRRTCPELAPLVEAVFPGGQATASPTGSDEARATLLSHMIRCSACTKPINIRYTVPQMISHPPVASLSAEERQRLTDALPAEAPPAARPAHGGSPVLSAPSPSPAPAAPPAAPPQAPRVRTPPYPPVASKPPARPPATTPEETSARTDSANLPPLPSLPPRRTPPARPPSPPPVPGKDTPLYDALLTQAWAREVLAQSEEITGTIPRQAPPTPAPAPRAEPVVIAGQASVEMRDDTQVPELRFHTEPDDRPEEKRIEMGIRVLEAISWAATRIRNTTIKIVIIVVAGAAGTLTGMNLLGPAIEPEEPARSLQSSTSQATQSSPATSDAPARQNGLTSRLRIPPMVTLDEFGQGSMLLTISGEPLKWRISAPGLAVNPSDGTLREGMTQVINLRAHRIRNWCGAPASVTAPLTLHGPDESISTTVRWRTC